MEEIWNIYKRVLPIAGGYMNDNGTIHVDRVQLVLNDLAKTEVEYFEREYADLNWFKGKQEKEVKALENAKARGKLVLTKDQRAMFDKVEAFVTDLMKVNSGDADKLQFVNNLPARDRTFIQDLADALHVDLLWDEVDEYGQGLVVIAPGMLAAKKRDEDSPVPTREPVSDEEDSGSEEESSDDDAEGKIAVQRVLEKYRKAKVVENIDEDAQKGYDTLLHERLDEWKANYYKTKLETKNDDDVKMVVYKYIEGLQWVMNYYYKGCSSWGWYYPYHYAPRITDFVDLDKMKFNFVLGEPFKPFQQLMGVLPAASAEHIPLAYKDLMYDPNSPILDFYPVEFEEDMNGKKQSWEATVKIPFIDHERLLKAMASRDHRLTADEQARNTLSPHSTLFIYEEGDYIHYPSSLPGSFPDLVKCKCRMEPYTLPELGDGIELITGLIDGVAIGAGALAGFPSMKTLPHHAQLNHHAINVHGQDSRNVSMIITIDNTFDGVKTSELAAKMVGERTFLYWPFLQEGMVVALSDELFRYEKGARGVIATPHEANALINFRKKSQRIESFYSKRFGIVTGQVDVILHVRPLVGLKRMNNGALVKDYSDEEKETEQAVQMTVRQVAFEDERYLEQDPPSLPSEFPLGTRVLFLGDHAFGAAGQVSDVNEKTMNVDLAFFPNEARENASYAQLVHNRPAEKYHPNPLVARGLGVSPLGISRIMSSVLVETTDGKKYNIGLSLKFDAKGMKVLGYSRKNDRGWEFSQTAYELCARYKHEFPDVFEAIQGNDRGVASSRQMFPNAPNPDTRVKQVREWLKDNGVLDFDPVTLFAEQLDKGTVKALEDAADQLNHQRSLSKIKRMVIKSVPRQALLKPAHAIYRLQGQTFGLGDRVIMAQDAAVGGVQLSMKGIVIGLNANSIDVVWDSPFIGGETLNGRCSEHRGSVVPFSSCLNLSRKQFSVSTGAAPQAVGQKPNFQPRFGPQPVVPGNHFRPNQNYQAQSGAASQGFRPRPHQQGPMHYGNAAQGVRPSPPPSSAPRQQVQILQNALAGKAGPVRPPQGNGHSASANAHAPQTAADAHQMLQQLQQGGHTNSHTRPPRGGRGGFSVRPPVNGHTLQEHGTPPAVRPTRGTSRGRGSGTRGRGTSRTPATGPEMQT
jgi:5'-3' exoribonuclease 1